MADYTWEPAEAAAKSADGKFMGLINGKWEPVDQAAKDASGKFMVLRMLNKQPQATKPDPGDVTATWKPFVSSGQKQYPDTADIIAAHPVTQFAYGAAKPTLGLLQLGMHLGPTGPGTEAEAYDKWLQRWKDMEKKGSSVFPAFGAQTAGEVLSPNWLMLNKAMGPAEGLGTEVFKGALSGAAGGASAPVEGKKTEHFWEKKGEQTATGTAFGAAAPVAAAVGAKAGNLVYHGLIEPWAQPAAIKGRAYLEAAGNRYKDIVNLLSQNKQIVPGSAPTAGEAAVPAGRAEFSALQQSAAKAAPSDYLARTDSQNAARLDALKEFAGTPAKMAEATAARTARTQPHYAAGEAQTASTAGLKDIADRPSTAAVLKRATKLMAEKNLDMPELFPNGMPRQMTGQQAQAVKMAFDDLIKLQPKSGMDTAEVKAIEATRSDFIAWMEKNFPDLGTARKLYKMTSAPINQMDVGATMAEKLVSGLREDEAQKAKGFAGAVRDSASTIKKATGEPRFEKLDQIFNTKQLATVHSIVEDLARADRNKEMARLGSEAGPDAISLATGNLKQQFGGPLPNMLHRGIMLTNAIINRMEGKVNRKLATEMAAEMLDPPKVGESMAQAMARKERSQLVMEYLRRYYRPAVMGSANVVGTEMGEDNAVQRSR